MWVGIKVRVGVGVRVGVRFRVRVRAWLGVERLPNGGPRAWG